jgi:hypothetical protein
VDIREERLRKYIADGKKVNPEKLHGLIEFATGEKVSLRQLIGAAELEFKSWDEAVKAENLPTMEKKGDGPNHVSLGRDLLVFLYQRLQAERGDNLLLTKLVYNADPDAERILTESYGSPLKGGTFIHSVRKEFGTLENFKKEASFKPAK